MPSVSKADVDVGTGSASAHEVFESVTVHVCNLQKAVVSRKYHGFGKTAVPSPKQDHIAAGASHRYVRFAIAVEIANRRAVTARRALEQRANLRPKSTFSIAKQHAHGVEVVGDRQNVQVSVAVEVRDTYVVRIRCVKRLLGAEGPLTGTEQNADRVVAVVGHHQIRLAILVKVALSNRDRSVSDREDVPNQKLAGASRLQRGALVLRKRGERPKQPKNQRASKPPASSPDRQHFRNTGLNRHEDSFLLHYALARGATKSRGAAR